MLGRARTLSIVSLTGTPIVARQSQVALKVMHSVAAPDRTNLTIIGTDVDDTAGLYSIDVNDGSFVRSITFTLGTNPGEFSLETYYHSYGPTGHLYLGDGLGGGSYYSADGSFLGTFSLDTPVDPAQTPRSLRRSGIPRLELIEVTGADEKTYEAWNRLTTSQIVGRILGQGCVFRRASLVGPPCFHPARRRPQGASAL